MEQEKLILRYELESAELAIREFEGWCDGFVIGCKLCEEPSIFAKIKLLVYERIETLKEAMEGE